MASSFFLGLFLLVIALPFTAPNMPSRFVAGMTFTLGAELPAYVADVFATMSCVVRFASLAVISRVHASARQA